MAEKDEDGMIRVDLEWKIESRNGTRSGRLYGLHEVERANAEEDVKRLARPGDTVTFNVV